MIIAEDLTESYKKWGDENNEPENYEAVTEACVKNSYFSVSIFMKPDLRHKDIAHECAHAVNMLFEHSGVKLSTSNDEPFCYTLGWVVGEVYKCLEDFKKIKCT